MSDPDKHGLNDKQRLFCIEYLKDLNATQAAVRAGYSKKTATQQASRLLTNVNVSGYLTALRDRFFEKEEVTVERIVQEMARLGLHDRSKVFRVNEEGEPVIDMTGADDATFAAIESVTNRTIYDEDGNKTHEVKLTLAKKEPALTALAKHLGIFAPQEVNVNANVKMAGVLQGVDDDAIDAALASGSGIVVETEESSSSASYHQTVEDASG